MNEGLPGFPHISHIWNDKMFQINVAIMKKPKVNDIHIRLLNRTEG